jgi:hypothetical protein
MTATATERSANRIAAHLLAAADLLAEVGAIVVALALASRTALPLIVVPMALATWPLRGPQLAVAVTTLGVAALFQPARRRIQGWVDRRFDRARHHPGRVVAGFGARLRDSIALEAVRSELTRTTITALRPSTAAVWLRARVER